MAQPWRTVHSPDGHTRAWRLLALVGWLPAIFLTLHLLAGAYNVAFWAWCGIGAYLLVRGWRLATASVSTYPAGVTLRGGRRTRTLAWAQVHGIKARVQRVEPDILRESLGLDAYPVLDHVPAHLLLEDEDEEPQVLRGIEIQTTSGSVDVPVVSVEALGLLVDAWRAAPEPSPALSAEELNRWLDEDPPSSR